MALMSCLRKVLAEIYYGKELDWKQIQEKSRRASSVALSSLADANEGAKKDK